MPQTHSIFLVSWLLAATLVHAQGLPPAVDAALARAKVPRESLVAYVAEADGKAAPRLVHRTEAAVNPASIAKLATTFAGLDLLGPAYTWSTAVYIDGVIENGTLQGNVFVQGRGDPKLVTERLWLMVRRLQGLGIRHIAGDIVLDRSVFDVPSQDPAAFDGEPLRPYNAGPDALLVNFKSVLFTFTPAGHRALVHVEPPLRGVQFPMEVPTRPGCGDWRPALQADFKDPARVRFAGAYGATCGERQWPVAYAQPASYSSRAIAGMWQHIGGTLAGQAQEGRVPAGQQPAFELASPQLAEVIRDINKFSNNVMAQQLFLTLGLQRGVPATFESARDAMRTWWASRIGGDVPVFQNGSGLSRDERTSAAQLARLLHAAWLSPLMPEFIASLPLAGVDGTLATSARGRSGRGIAHLKTGSLWNVQGVAGYVEAANGKRYVLVAIVNDPNANQAQPALDALLAWTAQAE
jgi:D-alanyl-D-alanine carboxypeptidase/D-alanyl-D-alanine-endopeptidase (penicillin-binding protein 4)